VRHIPFFKERVPTFLPAFPEHKPFACCAAWHLRRSGLWLAIYDFLGGLTHGGETPFYSSIQKVAVFFGSDYETTRRIFKKLRNNGWLELRKDGLLYYVPHEKRAQKYKDCHQRQMVSWQNETDPLLGLLYGIAGGRLKLTESALKHIRKYCGSDARIAELYQQEINAATDRKARGEYSDTSPLKCFWKVRDCLREQAENVPV
jgi:hypothetical protein